ncbi:MAG: hypothetical protein H0V45_05305 [Actinobacteria bacterium]|nr:hypothetical protein [Actinomycetota bacterium]
MALFWLSLALSVFVVIASLVLTTLRGLELFRAFKQMAAAVGEGLDRIGRSSDRIERHLSLAAEGGTRLDVSLARLRSSRARLNVQRAALADVRASLGRITGLAPRK